MRCLLAMSSLLVLGCFGEGSGSSTTGDDTTSIGTTTMSTADTSTTSTVDTSTQTSSTADTSDDDGPTTGSDCERGSVPTPPKPPGMWAGPGYMIGGEEPPTACPAPLGTGPRALLDMGSLGTTCPCRCEGELHEICDLSVASGSNCMAGLDIGGAFDSSCEDLPGASAAADVMTDDSACSPMPSSPPAAEIQLCPGQRDMAECFPLRDDMRGPCFWSSNGEKCPDGLDTVAAQVPTCGECDPCDHAAYCDGREWTAYADPGCAGEVVITVTDQNCHQTFDPLARSIELTPGVPLPDCAPAELTVEPLTVCCAME